MPIQRIAWYVVAILSWSPVALFAQADSTKPDALAHLRPKTFDPSFSVPSKATAAELTEYRDAVSSLLATGFTDDEKTHDLKAAQKWFNKARGILPDDPRAYVAFAIVQLQSGDEKAALTKLEAARKRGDGYAPAFESRTLHLLYERSYNKAVAELKLFADTISSPSLAGREKDHCAAWVGSIFGFYEAGGGGKAAEPMREASIEVRKKLPDAQKDAFDRGQAEAKDRMAKSRKDVEAAAKEAGEEGEEKLRKLQNGLVSFKNAAERKKKEQNRVQEDWGTLYNQQLKVMNDMMLGFERRDQELRALQQDLNQTPTITARGSDLVNRAVLDLEVRISLNLNDAQQLIAHANQLTSAYIQATQMNIAEQKKMKESIANLEKVHKVKEMHAKRKGETKKEILERHMNDVKSYFRVDLKEYAGQLLMSLEVGK